jgi:signal transduction histidine kinase
MAIRSWIDRWGDWAMTAALMVGIGFEVQHPPAGFEARGGQAILTAAAVLLVLPLAWRRRAPLAVLGVMLGWFAFILFALVTKNAGSPLTAVIALGVAFYTVGAHAAGRRSLIGFAAGLAGLIAIDAGSGGAFQQSGGARPGVWLLMTIAWLAGRELRRRRIEMLTLRARAVELEHEREERLRVAAAEERARIARELHDVVAHSVSVMVVQSQAAQRVLEDDVDATRDVLLSIETTGRQALTELRRLLGLLREFDGGPSLEPQPSLQYLDELLSQIRDAGLAVDLTVEGTPTALPQGVDLSAYRIVQEGLTNTLKHAGADRASVLVRYAPSELQIEISDDGCGAPQPGGNGDGHGLVGMRERVALYGGELRAGRADHGGYVVRARLPLGAGS